MKKFKSTNHYYQVSWKGWIIIIFQFRFKGKVSNTGMARPEQTPWLLFRPTTSQLFTYIVHRPRSVGAMKMNLCKVLKISFIIGLLVGNYNSDIVTRSILFVKGG